MFYLKHRKDENMKKYSEIYNDIKKEVYETFAKGDIVILSGYMIMVYDYCKKEYITDEEKELLFNLIHYGVKLLLERK